MVISSLVVAFYSFVSFFPAVIQIVYAQTASGNPVCSALNLQHWDKIVFKIVSPQVASQAGLPANTELDIKVIDDPRKVVDVKQTVLNLIKVPQAQRNSIEIVDVEYAIVCTQIAPGASASASASAVAIATIITNQTNQTNQTRPSPDPCDPTAVNKTLPPECFGQITPPPSPPPGPGPNDTLPGPPICPEGEQLVDQQCVPVAPGPEPPSPAPPEPEPEPEPEPPDGGDNQDGSDNNGQGSDE
jgi:hypothetical protein